MPVRNPVGIAVVTKNSRQAEPVLGRRVRQAVIYSHAELVKFNSVQLYSSVLMTSLTVGNAKIAYFFVISACFCRYTVGL